MPNNTLQERIDALVSQIGTGAEPFHDNPVLPPPQEAIKYRVQWREPSLSNPALGGAQVVPLNLARLRMNRAVLDYLSEPSPPNALLVKANAGLGKSFMATDVAQQLAVQGKRVLYLMPRHAYWEDITGFPHYDQSLWYHWQPIDGCTAQGEPMCRFSHSARKWTSKGYRMIDLCRSLCRADGHMSVCPYRAQSNVPQRIIAGVHNHAVSGLAIQDFDVAIMDELPLGAFLAERFVPIRALQVPHTSPLQPLFRVLMDLCMSGDTYSGFGLIKRIEREYERLDYLRRQVGFDVQVPELRTAQDVDEAPEYFFDELIALIEPEYLAYKSGSPDIIGRVVVSPGGIRLRYKAKPWENLPDKVVALDATGDEAVYSSLLSRPIKVHHPAVERVGRILQLVERYNGRSTVVGEEGLTKQGQELMGLCKLIAKSKEGEGGFEDYKRVCVVTYKPIAGLFEREFGEGNVMHFGGSRGSNQFVRGEPVDCLIVAGSPSPPDDDVMQIVAQIADIDQVALRKQPIKRDGGILPVRTTLMREYGYIDELGRSAWRAQSGFWGHPDVSSVLSMFREQELVQAIHRGRPLTNQCDVWVLTSVPTPERLDALLDTANELPTVPSGLDWRYWVLLREHLANRESPITAEWLSGLIGMGLQRATNVMNLIAESALGWSWDGSGQLVRSG